MPRLSTQLPRLCPTCQTPKAKGKRNCYHCNLPLRYVTGQHREPSPRVLLEIAAEEAAEAAYRAWMLRLPELDELLLASDLAYEAWRRYTPR